MLLEVSLLREILQQGTFRQIKWCQAGLNTSEPGSSVFTTLLSAGFHFTMIKKNQ